MFRIYHPNAPRFHYRGIILKFRGEFILCMNFLSHFYFDRHSNDSLRITGTVLPDLVRNTAKEWNLRPEKSHELFKSAAHRSLLGGWQKHLEVDRYFHNSLFFREHSRQLRLAIGPALQHTQVRPFFVAHIGLELLLDGLLLSENELQAEDLYVHLEAAEWEAIESFLQLCGIKDTARFQQYFKSFLKNRYLSSYQDAGQVAYALSRICLRVWPEPLGSSETDQLTQILTAYLRKLKPSYRQIYREIENNVSN